MLTLISLEDLPSLSIVAPRYLKLSTCSSVESFSFKLHLGLSAFLDMITVTVFLMFSLSPTFSLSLSTTSSSCCRCFSDVAIRTVSSAYLRLLMLVPRIVIPVSHSTSPMMYSLYSENRSGDRTHPCLTPLLIFPDCPSSFSYLTAAICYQYRFFMILKSFPSTFFALREIRPRTQVKNETEDDDMDQDTSA